MLLKHCAIVAAILPMGAAVAYAPHAQGAPAIATDSAVYVERIAPDASRHLEPASKLTPGDRVVTVLRWYRMGGEGSFVITNPLPASLTYQKSDGDAQEVSVDGGRTWGHLGALRIGHRDATPEDVTHIRWRINASSFGGYRGQFAYAGIVR